ncbi:MAG: all3515 family Zur-repressed PEP-CTERM protein [Thermodesulfobacteriota bacterium]
MCFSRPPAPGRAAYFAAVDNGPVVTFGPYAGLPNPNRGRLTFLFAHTSDEDPSGNHFHGIGAYSYEGPVETPTVTPTNTNNRIPETYTGESPLRLSVGAGPLAFRLISKPGNSEYSRLTIASVHALSAFPANSPQGYLFNSSGGRWTLPLTGAVIALKLVAKTEGLHIANEAGEEILHTVGDLYVLGDGNTFSFTPIFWADGQAPAGTYSATLQFVDVTDTTLPLQESGTFTLNFLVPEPITGTDGDDVIVGTPGDDVIFGGAGDDIIMGEGGNDLIYGGAGADIILGGPGNDAIDGGPDMDIVFGEDGDDTVRHDGSDTIFGGAGKNTITDISADGGEGEEAGGAPEEGGEENGAGDGREEDTDDGDHGHDDPEEDADGDHGHDHDMGERHS